MKTIIICNDCLGCCEAKDLRQSGIKQPTNNVKVIQTKCMGLCPAGKICTIILEDNELNDFELTPLTVKQLNAHL